MGLFARISRPMWALPLAILALLLQVQAPVEAARMSAAMASPFAAMPICSPDKAKTAAPSEKPSPARHDSQPCGLCAVCAPVAGGTAAAAQVSPCTSVATVARPIMSAQASPRGPPLRAPNARAPPVQA